jgi:hypothetical protein
MIEKYLIHNRNKSLQEETTSDVTPPPKRIEHSVEVFLSLAQGLSLAKEMIEEIRKETLDCDIGCLLHDTNDPVLYYTFPSHQVLPLVSEYFLPIASSIVLEEHEGDREYLQIEVRTAHSLEEVRQQQSLFMQQWVKLPNAVREKFLVTVSYV